MYMNAERKSWKFSDSFPADEYDIGDVQGVD